MVLSIAKVNNIEKWKFFLLQLIAFSLPLAPKVLPIFIVSIFILWLIEGDIRNKIKTFSAKKENFLLTLFYLAHIPTLIWSENIDVAFSDLEIKLSMLVLPLVILSEPTKFFNRYKLQLFQRFIEGAVIAILFLLSFAAYRYFQTFNEDVFFYRNFSVHLHPSYLSLYINFALLLVVHKVLKERSSSLFVNVILFLLFVVCILLLLSKTGIISFLTVFVLGVILFTNSFKLSLKILSFALVISLIGSHFFAPQTIVNRFTDLQNTISNNQIDNQTTSSTSVRVLVWQTAGKVIKEHPLIGVGIGDVKSTLTAKYEEEGKGFALATKLNAHNQFLQTAVAMGIVGFLILAAILILSGILAFKNKNWLLVLFLLMNFINFLTESILERQAGVIFFSFFLSVFLVSKDVSDNKLPGEFHAQF
jgi:O-antigen ligase